MQNNKKTNKNRIKRYLAKMQKKGNDEERATTVNI